MRRAPSCSRRIPAVDMVSFTGSTVVGRQILAQAAPTVKRVALELGGKSAQIYLPDALHRVAQGAAQVIAMTAGQACVAATRMLVPQEHKDRGARGGDRRLRRHQGGTAERPDGHDRPADHARRSGSAASASSRSPRSMAPRSSAAGGRPAGLERGYYFEPTVLDLPDNSNPAAQEEIFGPVLAVIGYEDVDDAVRIANDSIYGLSGQVYGADAAAATAVARRIRSGAVNVNTVDVQCLRAERGLQAERSRSRARCRRHPGLPGGEAHLHRRAADVSWTRRRHSDSDLNLDWLISVDDHILEPPNLWVDRVAAKDRDRAPHMETVDGMDYWVYDGKRYPSSGLSAVAGKSKEEFSPEPLPYSDMRPGLLRRHGPARGHGPGRDPGLAVLPDPHRGSAASCSWRRATGSSGSSSSSTTTTGSSRNGAARRPGGTSRSC